MLKKRNVEIKITKVRFCYYFSKNMHPKWGAVVFYGVENKKVTSSVQVPFPDVINVLSR